MNDLKSENDLNPTRWYRKAAVVLAVLAAAALCVDMPLARFAARYDLPGDLRKLIELAEVFAHGAGAFYILLTVLILDVARRASWPRLVACTYGAGLLADCFKLLLARTRPNASDLQASVFETFQGLLLVLRPEGGETGWDRAFQSLPSGHTATAVGLAIGLAWRYPHGRWLFLVFAALGGLQRIESGAHYLSDTLAAAALACLWAGACCDARALGRIFDRWEKRWAARARRGTASPAPARRETASPAPATLASRDTSSTPPRPTAG